MPLKLNIGVSKKIGLPDYGSLGASCHVEVELDGALLPNDANGFQERAKRAFAACRQAVNDELARQSGTQDSAAQASRPPAESNGSPTNGHSPAGRNGHAQRTGSAHHRASAKQLDFAEKLAGQIRGFGARRLEALASKLFGKPLADLSSLDASGLIDTLKGIKAGEISLDDAFNDNGAAA